MTTLRLNATYPGSGETAWGTRFTVATDRDMATKQVGGQLTPMLSGVREYTLTKGMPLPEIEVIPNDAPELQDWSAGYALIIECEPTPAGGVTGGPWTITIDSRTPASVDLNELDFHNVVSLPPNINLGDTMTRLSTVEGVAASAVSIANATKTDTTNKLTAQDSKINAANVVAQQALDTANLSIAPTADQINALAVPVSPITGTAQRPQVGKMISGGAFVSGRFESVKGLPAASVGMDQPLRFDPSGYLIFERGTTNLMPNSGFDGAQVGVVGQGGSLPTGWYLQRAGWQTKVLSVGSQWMQIAVTKAATQTESRLWLCIRPGPQSAPAPLGVTGNVSAWIPCRLDYVTGDIVTASKTFQQQPILQAPVTEQTTPGGASLSATSPTTIPTPWVGDVGKEFVLGNDFVMSSAANTLLLPVEITYTASNPGPNAAFTVVFSLGKPQFEKTAGWMDRTTWTPSSRMGASLTFDTGLDVDQQVDVLVTAEPTARWVRGLTTTKGRVALPLRDYGTEHIRGIYAFPAGLTNTERNAATDLLDPPNIQPAQTLGVSTLSTYGVFPRACARRIASAPAQWGPPPDPAQPVSATNKLTVNDDPTLALPVSRAYQRATNRDIELFEARAGDNNHADLQADSVKAEMTTAFTAPLYPWDGLPSNTDLWLAYSIMIPRFVDQDNQWVIAGQLHQGPEILMASRAFQPVLSVGFGSNLTVGGINAPAKSVCREYLCLNYRRIEGNPALPNSTFGNILTTVAYSKNRVTLGQWSDVVIRCQNSTAGTGEVEAWLDGVSFGPLPAAMGYNTTGAGALPSGHGPTFQHGIYQSEARWNRVYYANIQVGTTDLRARVTNPPPIV